MIPANQYIPSRYVGNGYGHYTEIDQNISASSNRTKIKPLRIKVRIPKIPKKPDDSDGDDPEDPDKNYRKKLMFLGFVYIATVSFILIEYFMFHWT